MTRFALFVCGSVSMIDLQTAFAPLGLMVRIDSEGRMVADPVPAFIKRDDAPNVLPMRRKTK